MPDLEAAIEKLGASALAIKAERDAGLALARMIVRSACSEELGTHIEISFEPLDAGQILDAAEALIRKSERL